MATATTGVSLLSLPDVILRFVFSGVTGITHLAPLARICRRLLPFALERLYKSPYIFTLRSHKLLARTFKARPDLQGLVKHMSASQSYQVKVTDPDDPTRRHTKRVTLAADTLRESLRLPACERLDLDKIKPETVHDILSAPSVSGLARLKVLALSMRATGDDWHAALWDDLTRLPALEELRLTRGSIASPGPQVRLASVRRLTLGADLLVPFDAPLSDTFPELRHLILNNLVKIDFIKHVLSTGPSCLETLGYRSFFVHGKLADHLLRYSNLSELTLSANLEAGPLLKTLASTRIGRIRLEEGCTGVDDFLPALLRGPTRMRSLTELHLDYVWIPAGDGISEYLQDTNVFRSAHEAVLCKDNFADDMRADWPDGSSAEGLSHVLELARKAGVRVSGSALECLECVRDFEEQFKRFLVQKSIVTEEYGALERHYGREEAGDAIVRYEPDLADLVAEANRRREEQRMAEV